MEGPKRHELSQEGSEKGYRPQCKSVHFGAFLASRANIWEGTYSLMYF